MSERTAAGKALVFRSLEAGIIPWTLLGFVLLSACVHAFGFYIFQTIYPPAAHVGPPPVQVGLLAPGTPEADGILRWIESEDPALAAEPGKVPVPGLMSLPYLPSYREVHALPVMAAPEPNPIPYPAGVSGLDLIRMAAGRTAAVAGTPAEQGSRAGTALSFAGALKDAAVEHLPNLDGLHEADLGELRPTRYMLGVSGRGEVQYVFLQRTSGDKTLDASASRMLEQVRFRAAGGEAMTWGFATFYWGAGAYAQPETGAAQ